MRNSTNRRQVSRQFLAILGLQIRFKIKNLLVETMRCALTFFSGLFIFLPLPVNRRSNHVPRVFFLFQQSTHIFLAEFIDFFLEQQLLDSIPFRNAKVFWACDQVFLFLVLARFVYSRSRATNAFRFLTASFEKERERARHEAKSFLHINRKSTQRHDNWQLQRLNS